MQTQMQKIAEKRIELQRRIALLKRLQELNEKKLQDLQATCPHDYKVHDQQIADVDKMNWRITLQCVGCHKQAAYAGQNPAKNLKEVAIPEVPQNYLQALLPVRLRTPQFPYPICPTHWILMRHTNDEASNSLSRAADEELREKMGYIPPFSHRTWKCPDCEERVTRLVEGD